jgi:hypothetical protein
MGLNENLNLRRNERKIMVCIFRAQVLNKNHSFERFCTFENFSKNNQFFENSG